MRLFYVVLQDFATLKNMDNATWTSFRLTLKDWPDPIKGVTVSYFDHFTFWKWESEEMLFFMSRSLTFRVRSWCGSK